MKLSAIAAAAAALTYGGAVAAQDLPPPVTMQPVPNPPEAPKAHGHHKPHHHAMAHKAPAKPADDASKK